MLYQRLKAGAERSSRGSGSIAGSGAARKPASEQRHCICALSCSAASLTAARGRAQESFAVVVSRMGKVYGFLGLSVGVVQEQYSRLRRQAAFRADITYVTSNALGFTYLQDTSIAMSADELVS